MDILVCTLALMYRSRTYWGSSGPGFSCSARTTKPPPHSPAPSSALHHPLCLPLLLPLPLPLSLHLPLCLFLRLAHLTEGVGLPDGVGKGVSDEGEEGHQGGGPHLHVQHQRAHLQVGKRARRAQPHNKRQHSGAKRGTQVVRKGNWPRRAARMTEGSEMLRGAVRSP